MDRVCAVIVTYNRKELLRECLQAVLSQTRPPDHVLVVDNASTDGTREMLKEEFPEVEVLALPENQGGAGGFHEGMKKAYEEGFDWLWIMDDDTYPEVDALAALLEHKGEAEILVPVQRTSDGSMYGVGYWKGGRYVSARADAFAGGVFRVELFSFVGPLINRRVIADVGLPRAEFFIWFDDVEYALRVRKKGKAVLCVPRSVVNHDFGQFRRVSFMGRNKLRLFHPAWKIYYGARNRGWVVLRSAYAEPRLKSVIAYLVDNLRQCLGDLVYEPDRWVRFTFRCLGIWDAVTGRLGKRYP
ncbi:glycosyltransferase family 2 protein [Thermus scotoductus]|uniref:glycosyltransferase family 2 protein n=1 Tax=Thermus scotoductus TaxID=37636 RepID=UPI0020A54361|nr:glycosyltransferase family 2 protein [Thermus scotoductus]